VADELTLHSARGTEISAADLYAALRLRAQVFVVEQDCVYLDPDGRDLEPGTTHLWLTAEDGAMTAYVRVLTEPTGGRRIGRVVTDPSHRGARLAGRLIDQALTETDRPGLIVDTTPQGVELVRFGWDWAGWSVEGDFPKEMRVESLAPPQTSLALTGFKKIDEPAKREEDFFWEPLPEGSTLVSIEELGGEGER
jgi:ElaA protein